LGTDAAGELNFEKPGYFLMSRQSVWDNLYQSGDHQHWEFNHPSPELVALVAAGIPQPGSMVLDLGCGGGLEAIFLSHCGFATTAVDISAAALEIAFDRADVAAARIYFCQVDLFQLPFKDQCFDFVNDRGVLHNIEAAERIQYAAELTRVLRPHGRILIRASSDREQGFIPIS
jgi:ubiquinone/menaquinone biosynthesis C-methylase UbiE